MSAIWPSLNIPAVNLFVFGREKFGGMLPSIFSLPLFKYWYIFWSSPMLERETRCKLWTGLVFVADIMLS